MEAGALPTVIAALALQLGYNAALVAIGALLLGATAGATGGLVYLRKRALISDAIAHATLPGIALAFLAMAGLGGDGRFLPGLLFGAAASALLGLFAVEALTRRTRLGEDAAIGAVLSVFFGFGVVLLTVIQGLPLGGQAGLEGFLLGSTAGMLFQDAVLLAGAASVAASVLAVTHRRLTLVAFDPGHAEALGVSVPRADLLLMTLVLAITVIGLSVVGLILIVALLIIPGVAARFWTDRVTRLIPLAAVFGGGAGYLGAAISASAPDLPTGPVIVLVAAGLFFASFLAAPRRGVLAAILRHRRVQAQVHRRQGLLALARQEPIFDPLTLRLLRRAGLIRADGVPTEAGRAAASQALFNERRLEVARGRYAEAAAAGRLDGLEPIDAVLTGDEIRAIDQSLAPPRPVEG